MAFIIKQNDTRPVYDVTLYDFYGTPEQVPIDLTDATVVKMLMRPTGGGPVKINASMSILSPRVNGQVRYAWVTGDTDTVGDFDVEYEITWADGGVETVPNEGYLTVGVVDDIA